MKKILLLKIALGTAIVISAVLLLALAQDKPGNGKQAAQAAAPASRVSVENGQTVLTLNPDDQAKLGIAIAPLQSASSRRQLSATAFVLPVQELAILRENYVSAHATVEKARANTEVSQKEFERLSVLYRDSQNISQKALQAQQGVLRTNEIDARATEEGLALQRAVVQQQWGPVVAEWLVKASPTFDRILDQHEFLVQTTLPPGDLPPPPRTANLRLPGGGTLQARFVSSFPRLDPRIQRISFLYLTRAASGIVPGLNLSADLPVGRLLAGVIIPQQATVWWQGQTWVYAQSGPNRFIRRELPTNAQLSNGWFVTSGFAVGDKIVVSGAQLLLSEESRPPTAPAGGGDTD